MNLIDDGEDISHWKKDSYNLYPERVKIKIHSFFFFLQFRTRERLFFSKIINFLFLLNCSKATENGILFSKHYDLAIEWFFYLFKIVSIRTKKRWNKFPSTLTDWKINCLFSDVFFFFGCQKIKMIISLSYSLAFDKLFDTLDYAHRPFKGWEYQFSNIIQRVDLWYIWTPFMYQIIAIRWIL